MNARLLICLLAIPTLVFVMGIITERPQTEASTTLSERVIVEPPSHLVVGAELPAALLDSASTR